MKITTCKTENVARVVLESDNLLAEIIPADGGRLERLYHKTRDCELIWTNPRTATAPRYYNCNYDDLSASGIEEAFPTVQPCTVGDAQLPFFGEVWTLPWAFEETADEAGPALRLWCHSPVTPARVEKTYRFAPGGETLKADYRIENVGTEAFDYIFGVHPSLCVYPGSEMYAPAGEYEVVVAAPDEAMVGQKFAWPVCGEVDFSKIQPPESRTVYSFVAMPAAGGSYGVVHPAKGTGLRVDFDPEYFPCLSVWPIYGGWRGHHCIMSEVFTAWPAVLDEAMKTGDAYTLAAGQAVTTTVAYTATAER